METTVMQENRKDPSLSQNEPADQSGNKNGNNEERFESDSQKIVRRHLENENDVITHDDIANVRVGRTADLDAPTEARFKGEEAKEEVEKDILGDTEDIEEDQNTENDKLTPWDTIDPK